MTLAMKKNPHPTTKFHKQATNFYTSWPQIILGQGDGPVVLLLMLELGLYCYDFLPFFSLCTWFSFYLSHFVLFVEYVLSCFVILKEL